MHEALKKFWKNNDSKHLIQPITLWLGKLPEGDHRNEETGIKGFTFDEHIGIETVKELAGKGLYVYAMRHGDDWCEPASIETKEVIVNFYAYLVVDEPLDFLFKDGKDWSEALADWTMDWGDEYYWV